MKKVLILGATGMLGSAIYGVLRDRYSLALAVRDKNKIKLLEEAHGSIGRHRVVEFDAAKVYGDYLNRKGHPGAYLANFINEVADVDYVINCIGITIPFSLENQALTFFINGALPHIFASLFGKKLIHITTDCVFDGITGFPYSENSNKNPVDIYGLSKSIGEPTSCLTLRTSIIGRELEGFTGLLEWFIQQQGREISGFDKHYWNGLTTKQFGKVCDQIMQNPKGYPSDGLYHVFSNRVSKYDMLLAFKRRFGIDCTISKNVVAELDRTLTSAKELNSLLSIPSFQEMINEI